MIPSVQSYVFGSNIFQMPKKKSKPAEDEGPKKKVMYTIKLDEEKMDQLADLLE